MTFKIARINCKFQQCFRKSNRVMIKNEFTNKLKYLLFPFFFSKVPLEVLESLSSNSRLYNVILENYPSLLLCRSASDKKLDGSNPDVTNKSGVTMSMRLQDWSDICCNPARFLLFFIFIHTLLLLLLFCKHTFFGLFFNPY